MCPCMRMCTRMFCVCLHVDVSAALTAVLFWKTCESVYFCGWFVCLCLFCYTQGVGGKGVSRSLLPAFLSEHLSWGQACFPPTPKDLSHHDKCASSECPTRALMPPSPLGQLHVCHRQGTGPSPLARTCTRHGHFFGASTSGRAFSPL